MIAFRDLTGQKFNMLTVLYRYEIDAPNGDSRWVCSCECGGTTIVTASNLIYNGVKSCGCLKRTNHFKIHGDWNSKLYTRWRSMIRRCEDPNFPSYNNYGGRGIQVCPEWHNYENFRDWVNSTQDDPSLTLDRIDVNGNYEPNNCRWATQKTQQNNKRNNIYVTYFNETHSLKEWCDILNLPYDLVYRRISRLNYDFWRAISTPLPDHYYEDCYDYDYSNEYYEDPYEYDNYIYDE